MPIKERSVVLLTATLILVGAAISSGLLTYYMAKRAEERNEDVTEPRLVDTSMEPLDSNESSTLESNGTSEIREARDVVREARDVVREAQDVEEPLTYARNPLTSYPCAINWSHPLFPLGRRVRSQPKAGYWFRFGKDVDGTVYSDIRKFNPDGTPTEEGWCLPYETGYRGKLKPILVKLYETMMPRHRFPPRAGREMDVNVKIVGVAGGDAFIAGIDAGSTSEADTRFDLDEHQTYSLLQRLPMIESAGYDFIRGKPMDVYRGFTTFPTE